jgi:hypothetical protein
VFRSFKRLRLCLRCFSLHSCCGPPHLICDGDHPPSCIPCSIHQRSPEGDAGCIGVVSHDAYGGDYGSGGHVGGKLVWWGSACEYILVWSGSCDCSGGDMYRSSSQRHRSKEQRIHKEITELRDRSPLVLRLLGSFLDRECVHFILVIESRYASIIF